MDEFLMQRFDDFRMVQHDFGHEGTSWQVAPAFQFENVSFGAKHIFTRMQALVEAA